MELTYKVVVKDQKNNDIGENELKVEMPSPNNTKLKRWLKLTIMKFRIKKLTQTIGINVLCHIETLLKR